MTKRIFFMFMLLLVSVMANAQTYQEVVYLKNGSVIRGVIIEQVPNESLKVQTADGSIFAYKMEEVEKITKEKGVVANSSNSGHASYRQEPSPLNGYNKGGLKRGSRSFIEMGGAFGVGEGDGKIDFLVSSGYQVCPYFFAGIGIGVNYHFGYQIVAVPIFAHLRTEFKDKRVSPFFDVKGGYSPVDKKSYYISSLLGCHFIRHNRKFGISIGVGFDLLMLASEDGLCGVSSKLSFDF